MTFFPITFSLVTVCRGTGHFSVIVGTIKTVESLGAAFSSLFGEQMAEVVNYSVAFGVLSAIAVLPILIYSLYMPSGTRNVFTGEMVELLSVLPNQYPSSSSYGDTSSIDCSQSSVDIDSSRTRLSLSYARHHDEENNFSNTHRNGYFKENQTTTRHIKDSLSEM